MLNTTYQNLTFDHYLSKADMNGSIFSDRRETQLCCLVSCHYFVLLSTKPNALLVSTSVDHLFLLTRTYQSFVILQIINFNANVVVFYLRYIFWTDHGLRKVFRASINGTQIELIKDGVVFPNGIAVDTKGMCNVNKNGNYQSIR